MSQLQGLHLHVQAHVLTAPGSLWNAAGLAPLPSVRPSVSACASPLPSLPAGGVYVLSPAPPAELPPLPPALLLTGNSWVGDAGARGRWLLAPAAVWGLPCSAQAWGTSLCTQEAPGVSEAPRTWSSPGRSSSCWRCPAQSHSAGGAWLQGGAGMGAQEGSQAAHGALRGCSRAFVALSGRGSVTRTRGSATHQVSVWFKASSRGEAELPLSTERGPAAAPHPYQHLRPARRPLQLHAPPPPPPSPARLRGQRQPQAAPAP